METFPRHLLILENIMLNHFTKTIVPMSHFCSLFFIKQTSFFTEFLSVFLIFKNKKFEKNCLKLNGFQIETLKFFSIIY